MTWAPCSPRCWPRPQSRQLGGWLRAQEDAGKGRSIPPRGSRLRALELTPPDAVRVVILGQDPYHGPGQAHGLCFSVPAGVTPPPSLKNIFKEMESDLGLAPPAIGNLESWARQGVLLLNNTLTVEQGQAGSHAGKRMGGHHRCLRRRGGSARGAHGVHAVGQPCAGQGRAHSRIARSGSAPAAEKPAPQPAFGLSRVLRFQTLFDRPMHFLEENGRGTIDWRL